VNKKQDTIFAFGHTHRLQFAGNPSMLQNTAFRAAIRCLLSAKTRPFARRKAIFYSIERKPLIVNKLRNAQQ